MRSIPRTTSWGQRVYCGPAAIALITGIGVDDVLLAANVLNGGKPTVGMSMHHLLATLKVLGYGATTDKLYMGDYKRTSTGNRWYHSHRTPLWKVRRRGIVMLRNHWVAVDGLLIGDQGGVTLSGVNRSRNMAALWHFTIERNAA